LRNTYELTQYYYRSKYYNSQETRENEEESVILVLGVDTNLYLWLSSDSHSVLSTRGYWRLFLKSSYSESCFPNIHPNWAAFKEERTCRFCNNRLPHQMWGLFWTHGVVPLPLFMLHISDIRLKKKILTTAILHKNHTFLFSLQTTYSRPLRRTIRQASHNFFTEALTFIIYAL